MTVGTAAGTMDPIESVLRLIRDNAIQYVDFRYTDPRGVWHHMTLHACAVDADTFRSGVMIDGSSIPGWKTIEDSDMVLSPDPTSAVTDPFAAHPSLIIMCDAIDPNTHKLYTRDPRSVGQKAEAYLNEMLPGAVAYFGPEPEFFIFDEVAYDVSSHHAFYHLNSTETSCLGGPLFRNELEMRNSLGHGMVNKGGYAPTPPVDAHSNLRAEMLSTLSLLGMRVEKHHHEVAPGQHELGFRFGSLIKTADHLQLFKYVVRNVAHEHGKSATFLAKPICGDNGSGMHVHQSIWQDGKPLFLGNDYNDLSETALHYIGGILKHARAITAFTNPTTNSYKRLVPGYEAPVCLAYSARNRSVAIRIPHSEDKNAKRIEVRFPDPTANAYFGLAAMLMAGLDGIKNKIHPGAPQDKDMYDHNNSASAPMLCGSLSEALHELDQDRAFLKAGDVFTDDLIDSYITLKKREIEEINQGPNPAEFKFYYSL